MSIVAINVEQWKWPYRIANWVYVMNHKQLMSFALSLGSEGKRNWMKRNANKKKIMKNWNGWKLWFWSVFQLKHWTMFNTVLIIIIIIAIGWNPKARMGLTFTFTVCHRKTIIPLTPRNPISLFQFMRL